MDDGKGYWGVDDGGNSSNYSSAPWEDLMHSTGRSWLVSDENKCNSELFKYSSPIQSSLPTYEESNKQQKEKGKLSRELSLASKEVLHQNQFLESNYGLHRFQIIPDGNCLYRSISQALGHKQSYHMEIRRDIVNHMMKYWNRFDKLIEGDTAEYLSTALQENTWGGYLEILAITELYDVNVIIVLGGSADNREVSLTCHHFSGKKTPRETIWLSWLSKGHYDLIEDRVNDNEEYEKWLATNSNETESDAEFARRLANEEEITRPNSSTRLADKKQHDRDYEMALSLQKQFDDESSDEN